MTIWHFWLLFAYTNILGGLFVWWIWTHLTDDGDDWYEDTSGFLDGAQHGNFVQPQRYNIIGTLKDKDGKAYYAVIVDKEEMDEEIRRFENGELESLESDEGDDGEDAPEKGGDKQ